jgi:hypothetical protein
MKEKSFKMLTPGANTKNIFFSVTDDAAEKLQRLFQSSF